MAAAHNVASCCQGGCRQVADLQGVPGPWVRFPQRTSTGQTWRWLLARPRRFLRRLSAVCRPPAAINGRLHVGSVCLASRPWGNTSVLGISRLEALLPPLGPRKVRDAPLQEIDGLVEVGPPVNVGRALGILLDSSRSTNSSIGCRPRLQSLRAFSVQAAVLAAAARVRETPPIQTVGHQQPGRTRSFHARSTVVRDRPGHEVKGRT